jgi:hypothetical protein
MALTLYPVAGKLKSVVICEAFAAGAPKSAEGDVFFGVNDSNVAAYRRARKEGRDWYYVDNAYIDKWRGTYFRATKNALQVNTQGKVSDGKRFAALGVPVKPWREVMGREILLCPQSDSFMRTATVGYRGSWTDNTLTLLEGFQCRLPIRVRHWNPDKVKVSVALLDELPKLHLLVTYSSASAITALLEGVPAISQAGAAHQLTGDLTRESVENPPRPEGREQFANVLADNQFTLEEFKRGVAWRHLNP